MGQKHPRGSTTTMVTRENKREESGGVMASKEQKTIIESRIEKKNYWGEAKGKKRDETTENHQLKGHSEGATAVIESRE